MQPSASMQSDDQYLRDILQASRDAREFLDGLTYSDFLGSRLHQSAVMREIIVVGEAASSIGEDALAEHDQLPWSEMVGMRHRLTHGYYRVDLSIVWRTVRDDIPRLIGQLERIAPDAG